MGKASRRKHREFELRPVTVASFGPPPPWAAPLLLAAAVVGVIVAAGSTWIHYEITASGGSYASFCNMSETVNCDAVVTSRWAKLAGVPVSIWGMIYYVCLGALAWRASGTTAGGPARADAFAFTLAGVLFSAYMAVISFGVLRTVCLLCVGLYVVSAVALLAAWKLAPPLRGAARLLGERLEVARRRPGLTTMAAVMLVLVFLLPSWLGAPTRMTREEVFRANPRFFDWYTSQPIVDVPRDGGHARGPEDAPVQIVEFSDFECPHCARAHVTLKDLLSRYRSEVRFVFHHFPLSNQCNDAIASRGHEHACDAAVAAECAADQEKFDAFTNLLFAHQEKLNSKKMRSLAAEVGLDKKKFEACLTGAEASSRVQADIAAGKKAGVRSTPTFFINGRKLEGNLEYQDWILALNLELDSK